MSITDKIIDSLENWGSHPVYIEISTAKKPTFVSAGQFKEKISDLTEFFIRSGIEKNYFVALFIKNSVDFPAIFLSLMHQRAIPIPSKLEYREIELDEIFSNSNPHAVITEEDHLPILQPYLKNRIVIIRSKGGFKLYAKPTPATLPDPADIDDDIASINYTYRGYGYPLGAMVPHSQYLFGANVLQEGLLLESKQRLLSVAPMSHIYPLVGCVFLPLLNRITLIIHNTIKPKLIFEDIQKYGINYILSVPEVHKLLLTCWNGQYDISSLEEILSGGSMLSEEDFIRIKDTFSSELIHGYGLTEFTPVSRHILGRSRPGTIGPVCNGIEYKIDTDEKKGEGELLVNAPYMAKGYYKKPKETEEAFENGWFKTGDVCRLDGDHLIFLGEKKKTCKINGTMVDLEEVRRALSIYAKINNADIFLDEGKIFAYLDIDLSKDFKTEMLKIRKVLRNKIAGYKIPMFCHRN